MYTLRAKLNYQNILSSIYIAVNVKCADLTQNKCCTNLPTPSLFLVGWPVVAIAAAVGAFGFQLPLEEEPNRHELLFTWGAGVGTCHWRAAELTDDSGRRFAPDVEAPAPAPTEEEEEEVVPEFEVLMYMLLLVVVLPFLLENSLFECRPGSRGDELPSS
jgi:hypothetical protein